jgi:hypothetical protein
MCAAYFEELLDVVRTDVYRVLPQSMAQFCQNLSVPCQAKPTIHGQWGNIRSPTHAVMAAENPSEARMNQSSKPVTRTMPARAQNRSDTAITARPRPTATHGVVEYPFHSAGSGRDEVARSVLLDISTILFGQTR